MTTAPQPPVDDAEAVIARLERQVARERSARKQAEALLDARARALYEANQALGRANVELRGLYEQTLGGRARLAAQVAERTADLAAANAQLRAALEKVESEAHNRERMFAAMSHEIRTPLHGIVALSGVLEQLPLEPDAHSHASVIRSSAEGLVTILNDVLEMARLDDQGVLLKPLPVNPSDLSRAVQRLFQARADERGLRLQIVEAPGLPAWVLADGGRLRQILGNLISNAIKFTERGQVTLHLGPAAPIDGAPALAWTVEDTGIGLQPEQLDRIFTPFMQAEEGTQSRFGGTGLGLSISRRLAEAMGGSLSARATPGAGAAFTLSVPLQPCGPPPEALDSATPLRFDGLRVLVVDDNPVNRLVARAVLEAAGVVVFEATDGDELLDGVDAHDPALALLDLHMPRMSGADATRALRARERAAGRPALPVLALTADQVDQIQDLCFDAGFDGVLPKPFTPDELRRALRAALDRVDAPQ